MKEKTTGFLVSTFIALVLVFVMSAVTFAAEVPSDVPKENVTYTITYPDGTKVTTNSDGEPLTYADIEELFKEENWRKIAGDLVSDADGKVELPAAWNKDGTIRIVETKVPAGYTQGTESEKVVDLKDESTDFVNPKVPEEEENPPAEEYLITYKLNGGEYDGSTADIVESYPAGTEISIHDAPSRDGYTFDYWEGSEYQPGDKYTVVEDHIFTAQWIKDESEPDPGTSDTPQSTPGSGAKTGDSSNILLYFLIGGGGRRSLYIPRF